MKRKIVVLAMLAALCSTAILAGCDGGTSSSTVSTDTSSAAETSSTLEESSSSEPEVSSAPESSSSTPVSSAPEAPKLSETDFKAQCQTFDYKALARNPDKYVGEYAKFYGQVLQVMEESTNEGTLVSLRVSTKASDYGNYYYDDVVFVSYLMQKGDDRILEDDMINIYGTMMPLYTYTTVQGSEMSIPWVHAEYVDLKA